MNLLTNEYFLNSLYLITTLSNLFVLRFKLYSFLTLFITYTFITYFISYFVFKFYPELSTLTLLPQNNNEYYNENNYRKSFLIFLLVYIYFSIPFFILKYYKINFEILKIYINLENLNFFYVFFSFLLLIFFNSL